MHAYRYHCLFCHGFEQRGAASAGVLAVDSIASGKMAVHMARMAAPLAKVVTVYTNGDEALAAEVAGALSSSSIEQQRYRTDCRAIARLTFDADSAELVRLSFGEGSEPKSEAFLTHNPWTRVRGPFAEQLGLTLTPSGDYVVQPPFNATSVDGVFAAGDCTTVFKVGTRAVADGAMAAAGVSAKLQEEKMGTRAAF